MANREVSLKEPEEVYVTSAKLAVMDRVYLPLFDRLERKIAELEKADSLFDRANAVVNG